MIIIDGVEFETKSLEVKPHESEKGKIVIEFNFKVIGESNYNLYSNSLKNGPVRIQVPEKDVDIFAKKKSYSTSSSGDLEEKQTIFTVKYVECNENEENWTETKGINTTVLMNWVRTRALAEFLIENELMTKESYEKKILDIFNRDREEFINFISTGKPITLE